MRIFTVLMLTLFFVWSTAGTAQVIPPYLDKDAVPKTQDANSSDSATKSDGSIPQLPSSEQTAADALSAASRVKYPTDAALFGAEHFLGSGPASRLIPNAAEHLSAVNAASKILGPLGLGYSVTTDVLKVRSELMRPGTPGIFSDLNNNGTQAALGLAWRGYGCATGAISGAAVGAAGGPAAPITVPAAAAFGCLGGAGLVDLGISTLDVGLWLGETYLNYKTNQAYELDNARLEARQREVKEKQRVAREMAKRLEAESSSQPSSSGDDGSSAFMNMFGALAAGAAAANRSESSRSISVRQNTSGQATSGRSDQPQSGTISNSPRCGGGPEFWHIAPGSGARLTNCMPNETSARSSGRSNAAPSGTPRGPCGRGPAQDGCN